MTSIISHFILKINNSVSDFYREPFTKHSCRPQTGWSTREIDLIFGHYSVWLQTIHFLQGSTPIHQWKFFFIFRLFRFIIKFWIFLDHHVFSLGKKLEKYESVCTTHTFLLHPECAKFSPSFFIKSLTLLTLKISNTKSLTPFKMSIMYFLTFWLNKTQAKARLGLARFC